MASGKGRLPGREERRLIVTDTHTIVHNAAVLVEGAGGAAKVASYVLPVVGLFAGLIPGGGTVISAMQIAAPWVEKVAAGAPVLAKLIEQGEPIIDAVRKAGPDMLPGIKHLISIATGTNDAVPTLAPDEVTDEMVEAFVRDTGPALLGKKWTVEEEDRHFARASAVW